MWDILKQYLLWLLLLGITYRFLTSTFDFWKSRGVQFRKPTVLFGNFSDTLLFRKSLPENIKGMYEWFENERYFGVFRVRSPMLILRDPDLVKDIFVKNFACFSNRGIPINSQVKGEYILLSNVSRDRVHNSFHAWNIRALVNQINFLTVNVFSLPEEYFIVGTVEINRGRILLENLTDKAEQV